MGESAMKKQIVIVTRRMITGGVERALIAMLKQFDYNEVDVDLYVELEDGELYEEIPKNIQSFANSSRKKCNGTSIFNYKKINVKDEIKNKDAIFRTESILQ